MKKLFCLIILTLFSLPQTWAKSNKLGLVWSTKGRTPAGQLTKERFEIKSQGLVNFTTSAEGMICASRAGTFQGAIDKEKQKLIIQLAYEVLQEQKSFPPNESLDSADTLTTMRVAYKNKVQSVSITKLTPKTLRLKELIKEQRSQLTPISGVEFKIISKSDHYLAQFEGIGKKEFKLVVPDVAEHAFTHSGQQRIEYLVAPKKDVVMLKAGDKPLELKFKKFKTSEKLALIQYQNAPILHHGMRSADDPYDTKAMEVNLCSSWHPKNE